MTVDNFKHKLKGRDSLQALQRVKRADSATNAMGGGQQRQLDSLRATVSNPTDLVDMFRLGYSKPRGKNYVTK